MIFKGNILKMLRNKLLIFTILVLCILPHVNSGESISQKEPKYETLEELGKNGVANNTLCIQLLSADGEPLNDVLILVGCDNLIGGAGGATNDQGDVCIPDLPNRKCRAHTRTIDAPQVEKYIELSDDKTHNMQLVSTLTFLEFKRIKPVHK